MSGRVLACALVMFALGCDGDESGSTVADAGGTLTDMATGDGARGGQDMSPVRDAEPDAAPIRDARVPPDVRVPVDEGMRPDVGPLDGAPCDPRLNARACDPGFFCVHVPQQRPNVGRCQEGDGCRPGVDGDCPPERPYCHLKGGATVCTEVGAIGRGLDCVSDQDIPQPCEAGLVCNNSVCQVPCTPGEENDCPDEGRCADISDRTGVDSGLCGPRNCNWFTGEGCEANQKCSYSIRSDGVLVGSCTLLSGAGNGNGAPCETGTDRDGDGTRDAGDNCAQGLYCVGPPGRERFCRLLCDTGQYEAPCPGTMACEERLATSSGAVRGYGLCVTNQ